MGDRASSRQTRPALAAVAFVAALEAASPGSGRALPAIDRDTGAPAAPAPNAARALVEALSGCYRLELPESLRRGREGDWAVYLTTLPGEAPSSFEVHFDPPSPLASDWRVEDDSAHFGWSTGLEGLAFVLRCADGRVEATAQRFGDVIHPNRPPPPHLSVGASRVRCPQVLLDAPAARARRREELRALRAAEIPRVGGDIRPPRVLHRVAPDLALRRTRPGDGREVAIVELIVTAEGAVADARVLRLHDPRLASAVLEAVEQWRFEPAKREGAPVQVRFTVAVPLY